jgi:hypothetical protein
VVAIGAGALVRETRLPGAELIAPTAAPTASSALVLPAGATLPTAAPDPPQTHVGCDIEDRGMGDYVEVPSATPFPAKVYVPSGADAGAYTLLVHIHGGDAARKILAPEKLGMVLATIDRGNGSRAYEGLFPDKRAWDDFIGGVDAHVSQARGGQAHASRIFVTSWSAGYKAVEGALGESLDRDWGGLVLLDSLHAGYPPGAKALRHGQLDVFVRTAKRASTSTDFFFEMTHTEIVPPGYASTTETADLVLKEVGMTAQQVTEGGRDSLPLASIASKGRFEVRGYHGSDAAAHCDQLRLLPEILRRESAPHAAH